MYARGVFTSKCPEGEFNSKFSRRSHFRNRIDAQLEVEETNAELNFEYDIKPKNVRMVFDHAD